MPGYKDCADAFRSASPRAPHCFARAPCCRSPLMRAAAVQCHPSRCRPRHCAFAAVGSAKGRRSAPQMTLVRKRQVALLRLTTRRAKRDARVGRLDGQSKCPAMLKHIMSAARCWRQDERPCWRRRRSDVMGSPNWIRRVGTALGLQLPAFVCEATPNMEPRRQRPPWRSRRSLAPPPAPRPPQRTAPARSS